MLTYRPVLNGMGGSNPKTQLLFVGLVVHITSACSFDPDPAVLSSIANVTEFVPSVWHKTP